MDKNLILNQLKNKSLNWIEPLDLAAQISISDYKENWVFLYSGLNKNITNSKSYIGLFPQKEIIADDFLQLEKALQSQSNQYFGYLSYNLKNQLENLPEDENSFINLPNLWMINFCVVLEFDHDRKIITTVKQDNRQVGICNADLRFASKFQKEMNLRSALQMPTCSGGMPTCSGGMPTCLGINSNFSKSEYLQKVKQIQTHIKNGDIYQANLTRKFFGKFSEKPKNPFDIFLKLNHASPANYSSFLKLGENYIISSSPELFLKIDESAKVLSSPIKGTAKKFSDKKSDEKAKQNLQNSPKEQAENLMIVDLVRNDLSRNCLVGSVAVKNLFKISSYKTLHHLSSDICGIKKPDSSNLDIIKSCFPAGSMTGAPKIKAMEICSELEKQKRGVYSGAIGLVSEKKCELSVVIRTLIIKEDKFEFQVGGAITFDSNPKKEWQETINKAKGIAKTLKIKLSDLRIL